MGEDILDMLRDLGRPAGLFELAVLWWLCYFVLRFLRGSSGLGILRGLLLLGLAVFLGWQLFVGWFKVDLPHLRVLLDPPTTVLILILGLVILFQPEIRRGFIHIGSNPAFERLSLVAQSRGHAIAEACERMARRKVGALIVIERLVGLREYTEGAKELNAEVDPALLESIFQPGGPLHDGAVLIRGNRILAAGCLLPLSENLAVSRDHGTRHRAALGVTEKSDALAIVVSEETGAISVARGGQLEKMTSARELARRIDVLLTATPDLLGGTG